MVKKLPASIGKTYGIKTELALRNDLEVFYQMEADLCLIDENTSALLYGEWAKNSAPIYESEEDYEEFCILSIKKFIDFRTYLEFRPKLLTQNP